MADNLLVAKWTAYNTDENAPAESENVIQFYKDGSCLVPVKLLGGENEAFPMFFYYQAFENMTIKFESGEPVMNIYRYAVNGDTLTITAMNGREFRFLKEEKKSFFKGKAADDDAEVKAAKKAKEPEPEREPEEHEWKCPQCGKINQNYVGTCGCGEPKPADKPAFNWTEVHPELAVKEEPIEEKPVEEPKPEKKVKEKEPEPEREPEAHEWKCPKCGKINQNYVGTCGCGEPKPADKPAFNWAEVHPELVVKEEPVEEKPVEEPKPEKKVKEKEPEPEREPEAHEWKCPKCGKINQNYVGTCGCGEPKPADKPAFNWAEVHPELAVKEEPAADKPEAEPKPEKKAKPEKEPEPERVPIENEWKCPKCGKINQNYVGTCGCGEGKPKPAPAVEPAAE